MSKSLNGMRTIMATANQGMQGAAQNEAGKWNSGTSNSGRPTAVASASRGSDIASQAAAAVGALATSAVGDVGKQADDLAVTAGAGIRELGDSLAKLGPQDGILGTASHAFAKSVKQGGEYLEEVKFSGLTKDLACLIRKNPMPALFIALVALSFPAAAQCTT